MPAKPVWATRAATILREVQASAQPYFDRKSVEALFDLRGRRALQLMSIAGVEPIGGAGVVAKENLVRYLETFAAPDLAAEKQRQQRFAEKFAQMRNERASGQAAPLFVEVPTAAVREICRREMDRLPEEGIELDPGMLRVAFTDGQDLLQKLAKFSAVVAVHLEEFVERTAPKPVAGSKTKGAA